MVGGNFQDYRNQFYPDSIQEGVATNGDDTWHYRIERNGAESVWGELLSWTFDRVEGASGTCQCQSASIFMNKPGMFLEHKGTPFDVDCSLPCSSEPEYWEEVKPFLDRQDPGGTKWDYDLDSGSDNYKLQISTLRIRDLEGEYQYPDHRKTSYFYDHENGSWDTDHVLQREWENLGDNCVVRDWVSLRPERRCDGHDNNMGGFVRIKEDMDKSIGEDVHLWGDFVAYATPLGLADESGLMCAADAHDSSFLWDGAMPVPGGALNIRDRKFLRQETDIVIQGPYGPLAFTRSYDSHSHHEFGTTGNPLDLSWTHSFMVHLSQVEGQDKRWRVHVGNGQEYYYYCEDMVDTTNATKQCVPETNLDTSTHLVQNSSGVWEWSMGEGTLWTFHASPTDGRYHYEYHRTAQGDVISKATIDSSGRLTKVETDDASKFFAFSYDSSDRLTYVLLNGTTGHDRVVRFFYHGSGHLKEVWTTDSKHWTVDDHRVRYLVSAYSGQYRLTHVQRLKEGTSAYYDEVSLLWFSDGRFQKATDREMAVSWISSDSASETLSFSHRNLAGGSDYLESTFFHYGSPFIVWVTGDGPNPAGYKFRLRLPNGQIACEQSIDDQYSRTFVEVNGNDQVVFRTDLYGNTLTPETCYEGGTATPYTATWNGTRYGKQARARMPSWSASPSVLDDDAPDVVCDSTYAVGTGARFSDSRCTGEIFWYGLIPGTISDSNDRLAGVSSIRTTQDGESSATKNQHFVDTTMHYYPETHCNSPERTSMSGGAYANKLCGTEAVGGSITKRDWVTYETGSAGTGKGMVKQARAVEVGSGTYFDSTNLTFNEAGAVLTSEDVNGHLLTQSRAIWG
ncbi:MAG: DUF6531 domain-containing protein, partial [Myxococcota bacterium]